MLAARRIRLHAATAALFLCGLTHSGIAAGRDAEHVESASDLLVRTEQLRTADRTTFLANLDRLGKRSAAMTDAERWHLRYLQAWEASFEGDYGKADPALREIIKHSADPALPVKAKAVLMDDLAANKNYSEAFELANQLAEELPGVKDLAARHYALQFLAQLMRSAGQYDLAAGYAREMARTKIPGEGSCKSLTALLTVLYEQHALHSSSEDLKKGIAECQLSGDQVFSNTIDLIRASVLLDESKPAQALALLKEAMPRIQASRFYSHALSAQVEIAQAYEGLGQHDKARAAALTSVAMSRPGDISETLRDAWHLLYKIARRHGDLAAALNYYENYVLQDKGTIDDVGARALAYQLAQQHLLANRLETEELNKQNSILKLRQQLDAKAVETSRLYILLLLIGLAVVLVGLARLKHSQLRFKRLASHDGLTGALNHQHFMGEAERILRLAEKKAVDVSLISIDLDHFKQVNDTHGHAMGDEVLKHAVEVCKSQLRASDLFGRLGGEEFGVLLTDCNRDQAKDIAHSIRKAISETPVERNGATVWISTSVGLACTSRSGYGLQHLCTDADAALYRAKRAGRNRVMAEAEDHDLAVAPADAADFSAQAQVG